MSQFTIYRSTDSGAPTLSGTVGSLVALLDACLVNGWTASVTSITRSGSTATVTTAGNHGLNTGNSTTIAGASQTEYNGTFVVTVLTTTTFTITVTGTPATPATGTITWAKIGAGWTKPYTSTNLAVFRMGGGNQHYLWVNDNAPATAKEARIKGYEVMTAHSTGTGDFPTAAQSANGLFYRKSFTADATARDWLIAADDRTFYGISFTGDTAGMGYGFGFGDIYSWVPSDAYRTMIIGQYSENTGGFSVLASVNGNLSSVVAGHYLPRSYLGTGTSITFGKHTDHVKNGSSSGMGNGTVYYPNPGGGDLLFAPVWVHDATTLPNYSIRGVMRGLWSPLQIYTSFSTGVAGDTYAGIGDAAGRNFVILRVAAASSIGCIAIETSATIPAN